MSAVYIRGDHRTLVPTPAGFCVGLYPDNIQLRPACDSSLARVPASCFNPTRRGPHAKLVVTFPATLSCLLVLGCPKSTTYQGALSCQYMPISYTMYPKDIYLALFLHLSRRTLSIAGHLVLPTDATSVPEPVLVDPPLACAMFCSLTRTYPRLPRFVTHLGVRVRWGLFGPSPRA